MQNNDNIPSNGNQYKEKPEKPLEEQEEDAYNQIFKEAFDLYADNETKAITKENLKNIIKSIGIKPQNEDIRDYLQLCMFNDNDECEYEQYLRILKKKTNYQVTHDEDLIECFKQFDRDQTQQITTPCLKNILQNYGIKMTEDEVNEMVLEAEYDKEGYLNYQKFVENLNKIKK